MDPMFGGGEMIDEVFHDHSTWKDIPYKFEAGTMQIAQQVGLGVAVDYLQALGMDAVRAHEEEITRYALDRLLSAGATVYGPKDAAARGGAVSFWFHDVHPHDLATVLDARGGRDPRGPPLRAARDAPVRRRRRRRARRSTCTTRATRWTSSSTR